MNTPTEIAELLRLAADVIEEQQLAVLSVMAHGETPLINVSKRMFSHVFAGIEITLVPNGGSYYDAFGEKFGLRFNCYSYQAIERKEIEPLTVTCMG